MNAANRCQAKRAAIGGDGWHLCALPKGHDGPHECDACEEWWVAGELGEGHQ